MTKDNSFKNLTQKNFVVMQYEFDFVNYSYDNFVLHLSKKGIEKTTEFEDDIEFELASETVRLKKDYRQLWVFLNDENHTQILFLEVDEHRHIVEKRT